jgi:phenylacetate-CoA ligase
MDLYTSLVSSLVFPLQEQLKKHQSVAIRRGMEATQWWDASRLEELQVSKLKRFLHEITEHVPYYRTLFSHLGFEAADIRYLSDLACLPLLDKSTIRSNFEALKSENARDLARFNTGGSSGEPLVFYISKERVSHDEAAKWRATRWWDVDIGDKEIVVWGSPIELGAQDGLRALRDRIFRTTLLPAFEMTEQRLDGFLRDIRAVRPKMLFGYPSALSHIAAYAESAGQRMDDLGIRVAFVTSERLYDEQRNKITRTFGCPVANGYGGRDAGFIAHECPSGGMHITAEDIIVETVDQNGKRVGDGEAGEIVVTHLATRDFPFIRYRTGDMGVLDSKACPCGRGLPLIKEIHGRSTDFVVAQDGKIMHGLALIYVLRELSEIQHFKIVQESLDLTRIYIVSGGMLSPSVAEKIRQGFRKRLGEKVTVAIEEVERIPPEKSGKFRYVTSKVAAT